MNIALHSKEHLTNCKNYHMAKYTALAIIFWGKQVSLELFSPWLTWNNPLI